MSKRFIIDGNSPGRIYAIEEGYADALYEHILQEGGNPYVIPEKAAIKYVFKGITWDNGEHEYWSLDHCEWFVSRKEREQEDEEDAKAANFLSDLYDDPMDDEWGWVDREDNDLLGRRDPNKKLLNIPKWAYVS